MIATLIRKSASTIVYQLDGGDKYLGAADDLDKPLIVGEKYEVELIKIDNPIAPSNCDVYMMAYEYLKFTGVPTRH